MQVRIPRPVTLIAVLLAALALSAAASAIEKVKIRAGQHPGFARIVFDWPAVVPYTARVEDGELVVRFERPLSADLAALPRRLSGYVRSARLADRDATVRIALTGEFGLRTARYGTAVAIDLIKQKPSSGKAADNPAKKPRVAVRFGEHKSFSRLVFDWPKRTDYSLHRQGETTRIEFSAPAILDISRLRADPPRMVAKPRAELRNDRAVFGFRTGSGNAVRVWRDGKLLVVDIAKGATKPAPAPAAKTAKPVPVEAPAEPKKAEPATVAAPKPKPGPTAAAEPAAAKNDDGVPDAAPIQPVTQAALDNTKAPPPVLKTLVRTETDLPNLRVSAKQVDRNLRVDFHWREPVAAAVFDRAGFLWVVFDRLAHVDFADVSSDVGGLLRSVEQRRAPGGTAIRMRLAEGLEPIVSRQRDTWTIDFRATDKPVLAGRILVKTEPSANDGPRVFLPVVDNGETVRVRDPEVGDVIVTVPILGTGWGVPDGRRFAEFDVLATSQGIAVLPKADGIRVTPVHDGVAVLSGSGLLLSRRPGEGDAELDQVDGQRTLAPKLFRYERWRGEQRRTFTSRKQELQHAIAEVPAEARNRARLNLARFYFAHGYLPDTLAVLSRIVTQDPRADDEPGFRAMRGAAHLLLSRLPEATTDLMHPDLDNDPEVALWRGLLAAEQRNWSKVLDEFDFGADALANYPADVRGKFNLAIAKAALGVGDLALARAQLSAVEMAEVPRSDRSMADLLQGIVEHREGAHEEAQTAFKKAIRVGYRPNLVEARLARTEALHDAGEIDLDQAIEELEKLRFAWRSGDFELRVLRRLGHYYRKKKDFRNSLGIFRQATTFFPDAVDTDEIARDMNLVFRELFLDGVADELSPITALALYYDFRELTPSGRDGDEMIRKLSDRLVSVDLLERAAQLLDHQVRYRLSGEEKARVGARLAVIYLFDRKPEQALRVLEDSVFKVMDPTLARERRYLTARAFTETGEMDQALLLIADDDSQQALQLRADVYWRSKRWRDAAATFAAILGDRWQSDGALSVIERQQLLKLAVSMSLASDTAGLEQLRERYADKLSKTPEQDAFAVLTEKDPEQGTEFRKVAATLAQVNMLEAFMASYRDRVQKSGLSALN